MFLKENPPRNGVALGSERPSGIYSTIKGKTHASKGVTVTFTSPNLSRDGSDYIGAFTADDGLLTTDDATDDTADDDNYLNEGMKLLLLQLRTPKNRKELQKLLG